MDRDDSFEGRCPTCGQPYIEKLLKAATDYINATIYESNDVAVAMFSRYVFVRDEDNRNKK